MDRRGVLEQLIVRFAHGNQSEFARLLNCQAGVVSGWLRRNTIDAERIKQALPQVDGNWLLTGEGTMLLADTDTEKRCVNTSQINSLGSVKVSIHGHSDDINTNNSIDILQKENAMLHAILDEKERLIKVLLESRNS